MNSTTRSRSVSEADVLLPSSLRLSLDRDSNEDPSPSTDIEIRRFYPHQQSQNENGAIVPMTNGGTSGKDVELGFNNVQKGSKRGGIAIKVRKATKCFGDQRVLKGLDMNVHKGSIYSLLGSSGCGKTTLLSCIIGIKNLDAGEILVFGAKTGTKASGVPGKCVGYMPQDIALYGQFSIKETLHYFGSLNGMTNSDIIQETGDLIDFLDLPDPSRKVCEMSGGQKRRLSLAVALVHSPELIILDEPTVGVDPLLRESIWNHLRSLVEMNRVTVIITTHYIDEARDSDRVGVMRDGKLLIEKSPEDLYHEFNTTILEQIVLKLCHEDEQKGKKSSAWKKKLENSKAEVEQQELDDELELRPMSPRRKWSTTTSELKTTWYEDFTRSMKRIRAMAVKNMSLLFRNYLFAMFLIMSPTIIVFCSYFTVGGVLKPINMGVINHELNFTNECDNHKPGVCGIERFSCQYLSKLPQDIFVLFNYKTEAEAELDVRTGKLHGFLSFPNKYSESVYLRVSSDTSADSKTLSNAVITFRLDETVMVMTQQLKAIFTASYKYFVIELLSECGFNPDLGQLPIEYDTPVFGKTEDQFRIYSGVTFLLGLLFFFPMCSTSISIVNDNKLGTLERARVSGVNTWEILAASLITEVSCLILQTTIVYVFFLVVYKPDVHGSHFLIFAICLTLGITGIANGFLYSCFCREEIEAILLCLLSYFPTLFLSGIMWPSEGMSTVVQYFSYYSPITLPIKSLTWILFRGMGMDHDSVWPGFLSPFIWILGLFLLTLLIHKFSLARK